MPHALLDVLTRLNQNVALSAHEEEVLHVVNDFESKNLNGAVIPLPAGDLSNLLSLYDGVILERAIGDCCKPIAKYRVLARVGQGDQQTIVALCS